MGTRGIFGFKINNQYKLAYNHYDSYIEGLGYKIVQQIQDLKKEKKFTKLKKNVLKLQLVKSNNVDDQIPDKLIKKYYKFANLNVGGNSEKITWYQLTREAQGEGLIPAIMNGLEHIIDNYDFVLDSLFCEWGYIIDFDSNTFKIYKGFQTKKFKDNEFGTKVYKGSSSKYYPIKLIFETPLSTLKLAHIVKFNSILNLDDED